MRQKTSDCHHELLETSLDDPQLLDQLWAAYFETKNVDFVLRIVSVLDWSDRVRERLETWLQQTTLSDYSEYHEQFAEWSLPIDYDDRAIGGPLDLDLHVALLAKGGQLKFEELPVQIPKEDQIRLAMKSAALWSLLSVAREDLQVAEVCLRESQIKGGAARAHLALATSE